MNLLYQYLYFTAGNIVLPVEISKKNLPTVNEGSHDQYFIIMR